MEGNASRLLSAVLLFILSASVRQTVKAQVQIHGTIYERTVRFGLPGVSVISNSGTGTMTDSLGRYRIRLQSHDSVHFSYLGKATRKFAVKDIPANQSFDMSLEVNIESLPTVVVRQNSYRLDSLANREEYRKVFDFERDYLANRSGGLGVGISLDALFSGKKMRQIETLRRRLEREEQDKYVDHRFTRGLVRRLTGLQPPALDTFMREYRPGYEMLRSFETEYDYYSYIKNWGRIFAERWKEEHPQR